MELYIGHDGTEQLSLVTVSVVKGTLYYLQLIFNTFLTRELRMTSTHLEVRLLRHVANGCI